MATDTRFGESTGIIKTLRHKTLGHHRAYIINAVKSSFILPLSIRTDHLLLILTLHTFHTSASGTVVIPRFWIQSRSVINRLLHELACQALDRVSSNGIQTMRTRKRMAPLTSPTDIPPSVLHHDTPCCYSIRTLPIGAASLGKSASLLRHRRQSHWWPRGAMP